MKLDPCVPYLGSLLVLVLSAATALGALVLGKFSLLMGSPTFLLGNATALLVLLGSYHALGAPLEPEPKRLPLGMRTHNH
ncbi:hypothetical protein [Pseudoxanthomonas sp. JBR18]|uniref:hypothetical protein n=1 Tax=Pseudoxanthomonas sp. JBR18 TaxID=2969308 RepID=UPI002304E924|nr:hypothetical protein [Pseudoxanthomonas sp. JBR18]WCE04415.1 hypothetical protein PJ250_20515 [Pseudoxanthomonas sp. JBR18]